MNGFELTPKRKIENREETEDGHGGFSIRLVADPDRKPLGGLVLRPVTVTNAEGFAVSYAGFVHSIEPHSDTNLNATVDFWLVRV